MLLGKEANCALFVEICRNGKERMSKLFRYVILFGGPVVVGGAWLEWVVRKTRVPVVEHREVQGAVAVRDFGKSVL